MHTNGNGTTPKTAELVTHARSILMDRLSLGDQGYSHGGKRDYYDILGYPRDLTLGDLYGKFERDGMAARIVEFPPAETWRDTPTVKDGRDKDAKETTRFARAWSAFAEQRRVYHYCQRLDTLAGIGRFGVLLIGVAGNTELTQPITRLSSLDQVLYLRPYGEQSVDIAEWETEPSNPRFGLPRTYRITLADMAGSTAGAAMPSQIVTVHHSRVIHAAEGLLENEVFGRPRLQRVYNLLDDLFKVAGGSAEATWKLMRKGFVLDIDPETDLSQEAVNNLEAQFDEYDHNLRRFMRTRGMTVSDLGSDVVEPKELFEMIISLISAATSIPQRILLGSERGNLASSQDAASWAGYVAGRQLNYAEPMILRPLIDRFVAWGALPRPSSGSYTVVWDPLFEQTDAEKATVADIWATAMQKVKAATGQAPVTVEEWRGEWTPFAAEMPQSEVVPPPTPVGEMPPENLGADAEGMDA